MGISTEKVEKSTWYKVGKIITNSVPFALLLSIGIFWWQMIDQRAVTDRLEGIEQSLSTRHIGIFPDFLNNINNLLSPPQGRLPDGTEITVFVDVLFYGAFWDREAFREKMRIQSELLHPNRGNSMAIVYYDNCLGRQFRDVVQMSWMRSEDFSELGTERRRLMALIEDPNSAYHRYRPPAQQTNDDETNRRGRRRERERTIHSVADSIASERFFNNFRTENRSRFESWMDKLYNDPLYIQGSRYNLSLFGEIDELKNIYLFSRPRDEISFQHIFTVYVKMTDLLRNFYLRKGGSRVNLIPVNEPLTIRAWSIGNEALFAFPGRFSTEEIGFETRDPGILNYINQMLVGMITRTSVTTDERRARLNCGLCANCIR